MSITESLKKDVFELQRLATLTSRESVKKLVTSQVEKLQQQISDLEGTQKGEEIGPIAKDTSRPQICNIKLINYAWDQSDKFVKLYVTLNKVHTLSSENIVSKFDLKSMELQVLCLDDKNYSLTIKNLMNEIKPLESYHKIESDMVIIFLKKSTPLSWPFVTEADKRAHEPKGPKPEENEDPSQSLMKLMKQMYDEGDDEMKRSIAKAWTEARDKQMSGDVI